MHRKFVFALLALALTGLIPAVGRAAIPSYTVVFGTTYYPGDHSLTGTAANLGCQAATGNKCLIITVQQGSPLTLVNADTIEASSTHSITSDLCNFHGQFVDCNDQLYSGSPQIFDSNPVPRLSSGEVFGISTLPAGTYGFHCTVHAGMFGSLVVV